MELFKEPFVPQNHDLHSTSEQLFYPEAAGLQE